MLTEKGNQSVVFFCFFFLLLLFFFFQWGVPELAEIISLAADSGDRVRFQLSAVHRVPGDGRATGTPGSDWILCGGKRTVCPCKSLMPCYRELIGELHAEWLSPKSNCKSLCVCKLSLQKEKKTFNKNKY